MTLRRSESQCDGKILLDRIERTLAFAAGNLDGFAHLDDDFDVALELRFGAGRPDDDAIPAFDAESDAVCRRQSVIALGEVVDLLDSVSGKFGWWIPSQRRHRVRDDVQILSLIHISEPTRRTPIS